MGAGIAALGCVAGERTLLHDPDAAALARGTERARRELAGGAARERWPAGREGLLEPVADLGALDACDLVVEAVPEDLDLERRVFAALPGPAVLATNTSSLPVSAIAAGDPRVVGLHFFNPPTRMRLVELVAGLDTAPAALAAARDLGERMGRRVVQAADGPGFLVNRCNRPFSLEALRCLTEGLAGVETIDRICRLGGGFRMGPFELMDLVGIDVGFAVARSLYEQSFGEPRWRPSPRVAQLVAAGRHGRKSGRGWYAYAADGVPYRPEDPEPPAPGGGDGRPVVVAGDSPLALDLAEAAGEAGFAVSEGDDGEVPWLIADCAPGESEVPLQGGPQVLLCASGSLAELDGDGPCAGFHALAPFAASRLVELTRGPGTTGAAAGRAEAFFAALGRHVAWVGDAPGLVLGRIVCQLVNEAAFALGEGAGSAADIDDGMVLGLNHPRGPLAWGDAMGLDHVAAVLAALLGETGEERYRLAPALRRRLALGLTFHAA